MDKPKLNMSATNVFISWWSCRQRVAGAIAVVYGRVRCDELNRRANQLAHYLRKHGVGLETRVGVLMERSVEWILALQDRQGRRRLCATGWKLSSAATLYAGRWGWVVVDRSGQPKIVMEE